jgi:hypothetical protein
MEKYDTWYQDYDGQIEQAERLIRHAAVRVYGGAESDYFGREKGYVKDPKILNNIKKIYGDSYDEDSDMYKAVNLYSELVKLEEDTRKRIEKET